MFLAGTCARLNFPEAFESPYILESFYYFDKKQKRQFKTAKMFLLDSGAFTFMNNSKDAQVDFEAYLQKYIEFINENDIRYFFELDVDSIVGYEKVLEFRRTLENGTGKRCIPVWHKSRGLDDFIATAKEYDYMAIGGIVTREIARKQYGYFKPLISIAHRYGCKVHGLGFTSTELLHEYPFDSVDSTSWIGGSRFGTINLFDGKKMSIVPNKGRRAGECMKVDQHNIREWIKFQRFAETYL